MRIKHGIAGRGGGNHIQIAAGREGERLWMQVRDNGAGLQVRTLKALRTGRRPVEHAGTARLPLRPALPARVHRQAAAASRCLIEIPYPARPPAASPPPAFRVSQTLP